MERGGHEDIPEENWPGLTTDMVSEKTLTFLPIRSRQKWKKEKAAGSPLKNNKILCKSNVMVRDTLGCK